MTRDELTQRLRDAFTRDGDWNAEALSQYDAAFWREWIEARLRHQDPWVPYSRDEYPDNAAQIFVRFAQEAPKLGIKAAACEQGAAEFVASLDWDPSSEEPAHLLRNALYLVGKLRARQEDALTTLRGVIGAQKLLARSEWPLELHRTALFALAALQEPGNAEDEAVWRKWLEPWEARGEEHSYDFIPAAFSGLAMSQPHVPAKELRELLARYDQARDSGHPMHITPAILALWVDREHDSDGVREELVAAVRQSDDPPRHWETIRKCADRVWPCIGPWDEMLRVCRKPAAPLPPTDYGTWAPDTCNPKPGTRLRPPNTEHLAP